MLRNASRFIGVLALSSGLILAGARCDDDDDEGTTIPGVGGSGGTGGGTAGAGGTAGGGAAGSAGTAGSGGGAGAAGTAGGGAGTAGAAGSGGAAGAAGASAGGAAGTPGSQLLATDGEVAGVLSAVNVGELQLGMLALIRADRGDVRELAAMMIQHHSALQQELVGLEPAGISPDSTPSEGLQRDVQEAFTGLEALPVGAFDLPYVTSQVQLHQRVLALIDATLLPSAEDPRLRAILTSARGTIQQQLQTAIVLQVLLMTLP